ncbi:MAG TPA: response regulator transcription factor [Vicinamibacterales bacterium]|nr:response regulator transcription factor [Vicinamibacterales bacterium]
MAGPTPPRRVLVVEDDDSIRELLRLHLDLAGFTIDEADEGRTALEVARSRPFDLVLLDVMLPGLDGVSICRAIRNGGPNVDTPILMLTAREGESDKVLGLESGADDYLTKPFGVRELMARIGALMRRHQSHLADVMPSHVVDAGDLSLDRERRTATVRGGRIELTKQEFDLLYLMASRPGAVFTRAALLQEVWSDDTYVTDRTVDTVISRLRRKIERDPQDPELLLTAWGVGYKFSD